MVPPPLPEGPAPAAAPPPKLGPPKNAVASTEGASVALMGLENWGAGAGREKKEEPLDPGAPKLPGELMPLLKNCRVLVVVAVEAVVVVVVAPTGAAGGGRAGVAAAVVLAPSSPS